MSWSYRWTRTLSALCLATSVSASAQVFTKLVDFERTNGGAPWYMSFAQSFDGNFYGTTSQGGNNGCGGSGCGTIFRVTSSGLLTAQRMLLANGSSPATGLLLASDGSYYGVAGGGGANNRGSVFKITRGELTVLYDFCAQPDCTDGEQPTGKLVEDIDGSLYGTTAHGGKSCPVIGGCGTVFKITPTGNFRSVYSFCRLANCTDGISPLAGLVEGIDGNFYGTTYDSGPYSQSTVFRITRAGKLTTLHTFDGADGEYAAGWLTRSNDGNFYGTTASGGPSRGGTFFSISPAGIFTMLYSFCSQPNCTDGESPYDGLVQGTDGNFYGVTSGGGGAGTVFQVTPEGKLQTLHIFDFNDGDLPVGGLLQGTNGIFYGTAAYGGDSSCNNGWGCGTIFSLDMGLSPFVTFVRSAGRVGQSGGILGQGFTGTTGVTLNGVPASFTVKSDTYLVATVPPGATSGYVTVTTPNGTLTSNKKFIVLP